MLAVEECAANADCRTGKSIKPVQPPLRKYSACPVGQISDLALPVSPEKRGGSRSARNAPWDAVDAAAAPRNGIAGRICPVSDIVSARRRRQSVRQKRVVLTPVAGVKSAEVL